MPKDLKFEILDMKSFRKFLDLSHSFQIYIKTKKSSSFYKFRLNVYFVTYIIEFFVAKKCFYHLLLVMNEP